MPQYKELGYFRITLAAYLAVYYLRLIPDWMVYFSENQMVKDSLNQGSRLSLFWLWRGEEFLLIASFVLALLICLFALGLGGQFVKFCLFILQISFHNINPYIIHEPQQLTNLLLLACLFLPVEKYLTFAKTKASQRDECTWGSVPILIRLLLGYIGMYYFVAGAKKLSDPLWRQGEALTHLISWPPFYMGGWVSDFLLQHSTLAMVSTYAALAFELGAVFFIFTRWRPIVFLIGLGFHLFIFLTLNVGTFPYALAPWYALMLDRETLKSIRELF